MKRKIRYEKLVRDKIPEKIAADGNAFKAHKIENYKEYINALCEKVDEEAGELSSSFAWFEHVSEVEPGDHELEYLMLVDEFADLYEVLDIVKHRCGVSDAEIEEARENKNKENGSFSKKYFLEWVKK